MSPDMTKLEHAMILHHITHEPAYSRLISLLSQTEMPQVIEESRNRVTLMLRRIGAYHLTDEQRRRARQEPPFSLESTGWAHMRNCTLNPPDPLAR